MLIPRIAMATLSMGLMVLDADVVSGQDYPSKPIRIITAAAGGGSDTVSRLVAQGITGPLGQPVIIENRGSGVTQGEYLSKAPPDGYGLVVTGSQFWITPMLQKVSYDVVRDFSPVSLLSRDTYILTVHASLPVKSVKEFIALARARPGELNFGSSAIGGPAHIASELFKSMTRINIVHVPYKGGAAQMTALISGEVQMSVSDVVALSGHLKSGRLRALAVTSAERSALVPDLPTIASAGLPGYEAAAMTVMFAPGKTPAPIVNQLNQEIVRFLAAPEAKERFLKSGTEAAGSSVEQLAALVRTEIVKVSKILADAGIKSN